MAEVHLKAYRAANRMAMSAVDDGRAVSILVLAQL